MMKRLLLFITTAAVCSAADDITNHGKQVLRHPDAAVQAQAKRYSQGLCSMADVLKAEETYLLRNIQDASSQDFVRLGRQLLSNYKVQLHLAEIISDEKAALQIQQKMHELEARVLQAEQQCSA